MRYLTFLMSGSNGFGSKISPKKDVVLVGILFLGCALGTEESSEKISY